MAGFDTEYSIVVVGAGGSGMIAALAAAHQGARILLLEKDTSRGCNTQVGGGLIQGAGTRYQKALGIEDSPELMMADIMAANHGQADEAVVRAICERSADAVHFLADVVGVDLHLDTNVLYVGHSVYRMHAAPGETGAEVIAAMRRAVAVDPRITFVDRAEVTGLIQENRQGHRFEREDQGYSGFARIVLAQPGGEAIEIFDQRIFDLAWHSGIFRQAFEAGQVVRAGTLRELAELFELPADVLEEEV